MIVAGEASGDMHGASLAREILVAQPDARLFGMGGGLMDEAGVRLLFNPTAISALGFLEVLKSAQVLRRVLSRLVEAMDQEKPDCLVVIDFPEFNMRLAQMAKHRDIPVVYYVSPSVWAWRRGRAEKIARLVKCVCSIFPFEADIYREVGAPVCFVGHPLIDIVRPSNPRHEFLPALGLDPDAPLFALLPGSREQEIRALLTPMLKAAALIAREVPGAQFVVPMAHTVSRRIVEGFTQSPGAPAVVLVEGRTYDVLAAADAAIVASGTATLEAAILGTPMVMVYKLSGTTYRIAKMLVKVPYVALPNIVAGRKVVEELLQHDVNPQRIAAEILSLWHDKGKLEKMRRDYVDVVDRLGRPGAVRRAARVVLAVAGREDPMAYIAQCTSPGAYGESEGEEAGHSPDNE
jgi:lipid-A-disaccharide synthase